MTLKKQLYILAGIIIAIPVLCVLFVATNNYIHTKRRYLTKDEESLKKLEQHEQNTFDENREDFSSSFTYLPPEMDSFLIDENGKIIISTIKNIEAGTTLDTTNIIPFFQSADERYIYQFTTHVFDDSEYTLVTRFPKKDIHSRNPKDFFLPLLVLIASLVATSVVILFAISRNMFRSIINIQKLKFLQQPTPLINNPS